MSAKSMFVMSCRFSLKLFIFASCLLVPMLDSSAAAQQPAVTLAPVITKVAGYGGLGYNGDGGPAVSALMDQPSKVALDAAGNLYIADQFNQVIRKVDVSGLITTVAGNGTIGYSGDGGLATAAQLNYPSDIVVDAMGNLFIADFHNSVIRKVDTNGVISTVAGNGSAGYQGDGGAALSAELNYPSSLVLDAAGDLYIGDLGNFVVRKVDTNGVITTVVGTSAHLYNFYGLALDAAGNLYIADTVNCRIMKRNATTGVVTQIASAGNAGDTQPGYSGDSGPATAAHLNYPYGIALDAAGNLYIADWNNDAIRKIDTSGIITTVVGNGGAGDNGDGGPPASAILNGPQGVTFDPAGNMYIADTNNGVVRKVGPTTGLALPPTRMSPITVSQQKVMLQFNQALTISSITTPNALGGAPEYTIGTLQGCNADGTTQQAAGTTCTIPITFSPKYPGFRSAPLQIKTSVGNFSFPLTGTGLASQVAITPGTITTFAGNGTAGDTGDGGSATAAEMNGPSGTAVDAAGNLYIADAAFPSIRKVDATTGTITTVAGNGVAGYAGDGSVATAVSIRGPRDVAIDAAGNLYFAELDTSSIRKVDAATGILTTYAGINQRPGYTGDGGPATSAKITSPTSIALDRAGNLYIPDSTNNVVRRVDAATGIITTVAGNGTRGYYGDNGPATSANLAGPLDVAVDASGNLYIADTYNFVIRKVDTHGIITTVAGTAGVAGNHNNNGPAFGMAFNYPNGLDVDAAGNVYIADSGTTNILKLDTNQMITIMAGSGVGGYSGDGGPATSAKWAGSVAFTNGISVDAAGNLFIPDYNNRVVRKVTATGALTFASTNTGSTSASQSLNISNTGNTVLTFASITASSNFTVDSGSPCLSAATLNPGQTCVVNVEFSPQTAGPLTGTLTITDDALYLTGITASTQLVQLSGTATGASLNPTATVLSGPTTLTADQSASYTVKVTSSASGTPTGTVTFKDGTTTLTTVALDASASATYTTSQLSAGTHTITASYSGDSAFAVSQSASLSVTVTAISHHRCHNRHNVSHCW